MASKTNTYVDPSIAADSGAGTVGDPYGDVQYALDTVTRDSTDGDRINIKAGTDELISSSLSLATYGTPTATAPLVFQGYTTAAEDGGIGSIDMQSNNSSITAATNYLSWIDMELKNTGSAVVVQIQRGMIRRCVIHGTTNSCVWTNGDSEVYESNIYDGAIYAIDLRNTGDRAFGNYISSTGTAAIRILGTDQTVNENIISVSGSTGGIIASGSGQSVRLTNNTVRGGGSSGNGIETVALNALGGSVNGNIVTGFSGGSAVGITTVATSYDLLSTANNYVHNCVTKYSLGDALFSEDNEEGSVLPIAESGSDTYANRLTYFAPVDTGNIYGGTGNRRDKGAVQHADSAGGVTLVNTRRNSMIGR